jgi:hypothetical protein
MTDNYFAIIYNCYRIQIQYLLSSNKPTTVAFSGPINPAYISLAELSTLYYIYTTLQYSHTNLSTQQEVSSLKLVQINFPKEILQYGSKLFLPENC